jgi:hypothetical protein
MEDFDHRATYSPEDNKLRIYPSGRIDDELTEDEYKSFKAAGYRWAAKQECFVCARWTPTAEDWAMRLAGEIDDEDYSYEERAADRAERFEGYREKRADEAGEKADTFEMGPQAFGHQSRQRAERQARRHDRHRTGALSQWSKAEYWQRRTAGVISHALYKSSAHVRRGRILTLEADQRKHLKSLEESQRRYDAWKAIASLEGADELLAEDAKQWTAAQRAAYTLANVGGCWWNAWHPTSEAANAKAREIWSHGFSAYDFLTKTEFVGEPFERLTPRQVAALYLETITDPSEEGHSWHRWTAHYEMRLAYENAMLAEEGGTAAAAEIEPGGWINMSRARTSSCLTDAPTGKWVQVQKVNKSPATGRVVSVKVWGTSSGYTKESGYKEYATVPALVSCNVERLGEDAYRAPTDEERAAFATQKKARKASTPKTPPLVNPTDADAARLQAYLNVRALEQYPGKAKPAEVERTTQARFSKYSGEDSIYSVCRLEIDGQAFRVRMRPSHFYMSQTASRVLVIEDRPQKPLPITWPAVEEPAEAGCLF